jgi:hypothetical protein
MLVPNRKPCFNRGMKTEEAIILFGSVRNLAKALDLSVQAIYAWGERVPPLRVYQIRELQEKRTEQGSPIPTA